jgi:hypothetical protein
VSHATASAEALLGQRRCVGVIGDQRRHAQLVLQALGQREMLPAGDVHRAPHHPAVGRDRAVEAHANCEGR